MILLHAHRYLNTNSNYNSYNYFLCVEVSAHAFV